MSELKRVKENFFARGQINENIIRKEVALSWQKSKMYGLRPSDSPKASGEFFEYDLSQFFEFCNRIVPEYISYFITNNNGSVLHSRVVDSVFKNVDNLLEKYVGTTSFAISSKTGKDELVKKEEHYLEKFTGFSSRTVVLEKTEYYLSLFYKGSENEYVYLSIKNSIQLYKERDGFHIISENKTAVLSNYLDPDKYMLDQLENKKLERNDSIPLLLIGRDADSLAWYYADKFSGSSLRISHRGIPENMLENKLIEYSKKSSTLIIGDFLDAPEKFSMLVLQIVDFIIENQQKQKKQLIITSLENPNFHALTERLKFSTIDLNKYLKDTVDEFEYKTISEVEADIIKKTLIATNWNISESAEKLGIGRATLYRKIKLYHFENN